MGSSVQKVLALAESFLDQRIPAMTSPVRKKKPKFQKIQKNQQSGKVVERTNWL
jgi:hypothetical protein